MKIRLSATVLALAAAAAIVPGASSSTATIFTASITESFCGSGVTCGTASTSVGPATVYTVITKFAPLPSGCFADEHTTTLRFGDTSTLTVAIAGTLCPTGVAGFVMSGTYSITGGSGALAGASGSGVQAARRQSGPIHEALAGTLVVP